MECGVAEFGRQHVTALEEQGHFVYVWTPSPQEHWPPRVESFDVVHVNYHPGTLGFLQPCPQKPRLLSAFMHEPGAGYWFGTPDVTFSAETNLFMPVVDYTPSGVEVWRTGYQIVAGTSSLRQAGVDWVAPVLEKMGIDYDHGQPKFGFLSRPAWRDTYAEVNRLAHCTFLVYWYPGANAGQSAGIAMALAAQRPVLLNHNRMFSSLEEYADELYFADDIGVGVKEVLSDLYCGVARVPRRARSARLWSKAVAIMEKEWNLFAS